MNLLNFGGRCVLRMAVCVAGILVHDMSANTSTEAIVTSPLATTAGQDVAPTITTQPSSLIVVAGNPATFAVVASSSTGYQWRRSGFPIAGAMAAKFTIPHTSRADAGLYDVVVSNGLAITVSQGVRLDVAPSHYPNALRVDSAFGLQLEMAAAR